MSTDVCGEHSTYATRTGKLDSKKGLDAPFISDYRLKKRLIQVTSPNAIRS
ncbi:hypothetical protein THZB04_50064 [Vibrio owensii]|nr:hypothetical protein THZB04_50064 [Vibrio owensii]